MAKKKRKVPGLNGSSLADISFILLIFFLITTSMDTDTGLVRRLPQPPDPNQLEEDVKVKGRNVLVVQVNMNNEIFEKIKKAVAEQLDIDEDSILETSNFTTDLHADSLALLEILISLEEEFDIEIGEGGGENIKTVKDAIEDIENAIED